MVIFVNIGGAIIYHSILSLRSRITRLSADVYSGTSYHSLVVECVYFGFYKRPRLILFLQ